MEKEQIKYYTDKAKNLMDRVMACEELHDLDKTKNIQPHISIQLLQLCQLQCSLSLKVMLSAKLS